MSKGFEAALKDDAEGIVTLASCRADETSIEAPWRKQGLFTYWLVQGLAGAADREVEGNRNGVITVDELYDFVYDRVRTEALKKKRHRQTPFRLAAISGRIELAYVPVQQSQQPAPQRPSAAGTPARQPREATIYTKWPFDSKEAKRRQQETAKALGVPVETELDCGDGVKLKLTLIPAGKFIMGSPEDEEGRDNNEGP
jgi:uncharacterized caspase-like protein